MVARKILILGGTGMLGHLLFGELSGRVDYEVYATARRSAEAKRFFPGPLAEKIWPEEVDADNFDTITRAIGSLRPHVVINCIGLIKQQSRAADPLSAISLNARLPHRIALICQAANARMVHFSTDCVFDGKKGNYRETDISNAEDLYGRTKFLGEVSGPRCLTLRTSIIGHELKGRLGLVEWFMSQSGKVRGYTKAIYSGFPTIEMARIIGDFVLPNEALQGVYHVSSTPISKYDLLRLVSGQYGRNIEISSYGKVIEDRSLDSGKFRQKTGYVPPSWPELVKIMYEDYYSKRGVQYEIPGK